MGSHDNDAIVDAGWPSDADYLPKIIVKGIVLNSPRTIEFWPQEWGNSFAVIRRRKDSEAYWDVIYDHILSNYAVN